MLVRGSLVLALVALAGPLGAQAPTPPAPAPAPPTLAPAPPSSLGDSVRRIALGQTVTGTLTTRDRQLTADSTYAQEWSFDGRAGQTVTIDVAAADFDPFVFLLGPGLRQPQQDDDGGGDCNARLTATLPDSATYTIVVNAAQKRATGRFTLTVTPGSKLPSLARCARIR